MIQLPSSPLESQLLAFWRWEYKPQEDARCVLLVSAADEKILSFRLDNSKRRDDYYKKRCRIPLADMASDSLGLRSGRVSWDTRTETYLIVNLGTALGRRVITCGYRGNQGTSPFRTNDFKFPPTKANGEKGDQGP